MIDINKLNKRLKGYHKTFRGRFLFLRNKILTEGEFVLWDLSFNVLADWDKNHIETYGTFPYTWADIAFLLGCSESIICRRSEKLFKHHLWERLINGSIKVSGIEIIDLLAEITKKEGVVDLQDYLAKTQSYNAKLHENNVKLQRIYPKEEIPDCAQNLAKTQISASKAHLVSFKGESRVIRTDEEYQKILEEGGYTRLTVEDMKWIDENVKEDLRVPS